MHVHCRPGTFPEPEEAVANMKPKKGPGVSVWIRMFAQHGLPKETNKHAEHGWTPFGQERLPAVSQYRLSGRPSHSCNRNGIEVYLYGDGLGLVIGSVLMQIQGAL